MNGDVVCELHTYGGLFLGSRLRRLSELMHAGVEKIYRRHGVTIASGALPLLMLLRDHDEPLSIGELARRMGQSHVAVSRVSRELSRAGLAGEVGHARDQRRVMLLLLPKGRALLERLEPAQAAIVAAVDEMARSSGDLLRSVRALEEALEEQDFAARVAARQKNKRRNRSRAV